MRRGSWSRCEQFVANITSPTATGSAAVDRHPRRRNRPGPPEVRYCGCRIQCFGDDVVFRSTSSSNSGSGSSEAESEGGKLGDRSTASRRSDAGDATAGLASCGISLAGGSDSPTSARSALPGFSNSSALPNVALNRSRSTRDSSIGSRKSSYDGGRVRFGSFAGCDPASACSSPPSRGGWGVRHRAARWGGSSASPGGVAVLTSGNVGNVSRPTV